MRSEICDLEHCALGLCLRLFGEFELLRGFSRAFQGISMGSKIFKGNPSRSDSTSEFWGLGLWMACHRSQWHARLTGGLHEPQDAGPDGHVLQFNARVSSAGDLEHSNGRVHAKGVVLCESVSAF